MSNDLVARTEKRILDLYGAYHDNPNGSEADQLLEEMSEEVGNLADLAGLELHEMAASIDRRYSIDLPV